MNRLMALRVMEGYDSRQKLADAIREKAGGDTSKEISVSVIERMEKGAAPNPRWNIVSTLSQFFNVSPYFLMGETNGFDGAESNEKLRKWKAEAEAKPESKFEESYFGELKETFLQRINSL